MNFDQNFVKDSKHLLHLESLNMVSRQLPPRKIDPQIIVPWTIVPRIIAPRTIAPEKNCLPDNYPPGQLPRRKLPPDNCPPDNCPRGKLLPGNCPLDYCSRTITPKIITVWQYTPRNWPRGKLPLRWFVTYIIALRANDPEENCPAGKLSQGKIMLETFFPQKSKLQSFNW